MLVTALGGGHQADPGRVLAAGLLLAGSLLRYETSLPVPAWWFGLGERTLVALELAIAAVVTAWVAAAATAAVPGGTEPADNYAGSPGIPQA